MDTDIYMTHNFQLDVHTYYPLFGEIERIPPVNRVQWQSYIWKLAGSGAEAIDPLKSNQYPPENGKGLDNRNDKDDRI